jgi:hypothetical protein
VARKPRKTERKKRGESWGTESKKLIDAAWFLAGAAENQDDGKDAEDARAVFFGGAPGPVKEKPKTFGVLLENAEVLSWFLKLQTQWRMSMNGPVGLDYGVFVMCAKDEGVKRGDRVWLLEDLRLLEKEYLTAIRLKQSRERAT